MLRRGVSQADLTDGEIRQAVIAHCTATRPPLSIANCVEATPRAAPRGAPGRAGAAAGTTEAGAAQPESAGARRGGLRANEQAPAAWSAAGA